MIDIYAEKTKISRQELSDMMKAETWMNAKEMKERGFIDTILNGEGLKAKFDLSIFSNVPDSLVEKNGDNYLTGFDVERILREAKAPKSFAKAAAAACRAAGLFDRCHADNGGYVSDGHTNGINDEDAEYKELVEMVRRFAESIGK
jgi:hypothetical protein